MAEIIDLSEWRSEPKARIKSLADSGVRSGSGAILLFNGVRYSRKEIEPSGSSTERAGRGQNHS